MLRTSGLRLVDNAQRSFPSRLRAGPKPVALLRCNSQRDRVAPYGQQAVRMRVSKAHRGG
jgi:hypothetical protein